MERLQQRMKAWENWAKDINNNVQTTAGKLTIIENDFKVLINDLKSVDDKTNTHASQMEQINNDLTVVKTDLGRFGTEILRIDTNQNNLSSLRDFVGMNNYPSLDSAIASLGYKKNIITDTQIDIAGTDFTRGRVTTPYGVKTLGQQAQWAYDLLVEHRNRVLALEGFRGDAEERLHISDLRDAQYTALIDALRSDTNTAINGLGSFVGRDTYDSLDGYINALGFIKEIDIVDGVINADIVAGWGFLRELDWPTTNIGSALCGIRDANDKFRSLNDVFGSIIGDLGILGRLNQCFRASPGSDSKFKNFLVSMETQFDEMKAKFDKIVSEFTAYPGSLQYLLNEAGKHLTHVSAGTKGKARLEELRALVMGGQSSFSDYGFGVPTVYGSYFYKGFKSQFEGMSDALDKLKSKVTELKKCGTDNYVW